MESHNQDRISSHSQASTSMQIHPDRIKWKNILKYAKTHALLDQNRENVLSLAIEQNFLNESELKKLIVYIGASIIREENNKKLGNAVNEQVIDYISLIDKKGDLPIHYAMMTFFTKSMPWRLKPNPYIDLIEILADLYPESLDIKNKQGQTPLNILTDFCKQNPTNEVSRKLKIDLLILQNTIKAQKKEFKEEQLELKKVQKEIIMAQKELEKRDAFLLQKKLSTKATNELLLEEDEKNKKKEREKAKKERRKKEKEKENISAIMIQRNLRRYLQRQQLLQKQKHKQENNSAIIIQKHLKGHLQRQKLLQKQKQQGLNKSALPWEQPLNLPPDDDILFPWKKDPTYRPNKFSFGEMNEDLKRLK